MRTPALVLILAGSVAAQQETLSQDATIELSERGDARMSIRFQLTARTWLEWRERFGDHPDLLWRDLKHRFPMFELYDYRLERNDVDRKADVSVKVRGASAHKAGGTYEFYFPKTWRKVSESSKEWVFSSSEIAGQNVIFQQTMKIVLPNGAQGGKLQDAGEGQMKLEYSVPTAKGPSKTLGWLLALVGLIGGAGMVLLRLLSGARRKAVGPVAVVPAVMEPSAATFAAKTE